MAPAGVTHRLHLSRLSRSGCPFMPDQQSMLLRPWSAAPEQSTCLDVPCAALPEQRVDMLQGTLQDEASESLWQQLCPSDPLILIRWTAAIG